MKYKITMFAFESQCRPGERSKNAQKFRDPVGLRLFVAYTHRASNTYWNYFNQVIGALLQFRKMLFTTNDRSYDHSSSSSLSKTFSVVKSFGAITTSFHTYRFAPVSVRAEEMAQKIQRWIIFIVSTICRYRSSRRLDDSTHSIQRDIPILM